MKFSFAIIKRNILTGSASGSASGGAGSMATTTPQYPGFIGAVWNLFWTGNIYGTTASSSSAGKIKYI
jgi:hypothetical protein